MKSIVLYFIFSLAKAFASCSEGYYEFNKHCYFFQLQPASFPSAEIFCNELNGNLASVHDGFTNALFTGEIQNTLPGSTNFWIGLNTLLIPGNWSWTDNTIYDFCEWAPTEPKTTSMSCVSITTKNGLWVTDDCFSIKPYVCGVPSLSTNSTKTTTKVSSIATPIHLETTPKPMQKNCSDGWIYLQETDSCYIRGGLKFANWTYAEHFCTTLGAHSVSFHSWHELDSVSEKFGWIFFWTGAYSTDNETIWKYTDGSPFDFAPWKLGYPYNNHSNPSYAFVWNYYLGEEIYFVDAVDQRFNVETLCKRPRIYHQEKMNCSKGWIYFEPTNSCYGFYGELYYIETWDKANVICTYQDAYLLSVHSSDEAKFVTAFAFHMYADSWIGLFSNDSGNSWQWSDKSSVDYLPWKSPPSTWHIYKKTACASISNREPVPEVFVATDWCDTDENWVLCKKPATSSVVSLCPPGWLYYKSTHACYGRDGKSYFWQDGEKFCKSFGAHLISIHSIEELHFATDFASGTGSTWAGLYSDDNQTSWRWSDGSPTDFLPWFLQPNGADKNCVIFTGENFMYYPCNVKNKIMCKKPAIH